MDMDDFWIAVAVTITILGLVNYGIILYTKIQRWRRHD